MSWAERVLNTLSMHGHRVTGPRRAILEQIMHYTQPFSAEQLFRDLGGIGGPIGRATIYRTVDLLLGDGWLSRVHWRAARDASNGHDHAYVAIEQGLRHHIVCRTCGVVVAIAGEQIDKFATNAAEHAGFIYETCALELYGLCPACQMG
jgi:Fur family ferric uptake transcriptional regulator